MKRKISRHEIFLRQKLLDVMGIILDATKHIDNDILDFDITKRFSIYIDAKSIVKVRKLKTYLEKKI